MTNKLLPGAAFNLNQKTVIEIDEEDSTFVCDSSVGAVDVVATGVTVQLCDAEHAPRVGDLHKVNALAGDVIVTGGTYPIVGNGNLVPQDTCTWYELVKDLGNGFAWVALSGGGGGYGELLTGNIAGMAALVTASLVDRIRARPQNTVDQSFELSKTSTLTADGITIVNTLESNSGALPGRWIRILSHVPRWTKQTTWYIDPTNVDANDENDGNTALTPLLTMGELARRLQYIDFTTYTVNIQSDVPSTDVFDFNPKFTSSGSDSAVTAAVNFLGVTTNGTNDTVAAAVGTTPTTNTQASLQGAVAPVVGKILLMTSGALNGFTAVVAKDLGGNDARVSNWYNPTTGGFTTVGTAPAPGDTFRVLTLTTINASLRYANVPQRLVITWRNLKLPTISVESAATNFLTCEITGSLTVLHGTRFNVVPSYLGCSVKPTARLINVFDCRARFIGGAIIDADLRSLGTVRLEITNLLVQTGEVSGGVAANGAFDTSPNEGKIAVFATTFGLGVFDSPTNGVRLSRKCTMSVDAPLYGSGNTLFGAAVNVGATMLIRSTVTPTITGTSGEVQLDSSTTVMPSIGSSPGVQAGTDTLAAGTKTVNATLTAGSTIQVSMRDPGAGAITGFASFEIPVASRGPGSFVVNAIDDAKALIATAVCTFDWLVQQTPVALSTWTTWVLSVASGGFGRNAFSPKSGARIIDAVFP